MSPENCGSLTKPRIKGEGLNYSNGLNSVYAEKIVRLKFNKKFNISPNVKCSP
jgi:hypothetical protein